MRARLLVLASLVYALGISPAGVTGATGAITGMDSWLAYGHDAQLTNFVPSALLTPATAPLLSTKWTASLDGAVVASPLYAKGILIVETEAGSIYALNPTDGAVIWRDAFGTVTTLDNACGSYGFSSTGAIDEDRSLVYAISADGHLHALDLTTGAEAQGWPIDITVARNQIEYVWGGLRLLGNTLYVGVASYCDEPGPGDVAAEGRIVAIDVSDREEVARFDPVPGFGNLGGVWGWGGVSISPDGSALYTGVGNSYVLDASCNCYQETVGYGDEMVELTPSLVAVDANRPQEVEKTAPGGDIDFGAAPALFQPPGCPPLAAANNKLGILYIWDRTDLARGPLFEFPLGDAVAPFVGQPSYSPLLRMFFDAEAVVRDGSVKLGDGIAAFGVDAGCKIRPRWLTKIGVGSEPPPVIVGDVVIGAGGEVGGYAVLDARDGEVVSRLSTNDVPTISPPIAVGDIIFGGDVGGTVRAFALAFPDRAPRGHAWGTQME
jgi:outer membrane protein assembly factor BamB